MGKQSIPSKQVKLDKGPNNTRVAVKRNVGKSRFKVKKGMKRVHKVAAKSEHKRKSVGMSYRTDIAGNRVTPNHSKATL